MELLANTLSIEIAAAAQNALHRYTQSRARVTQYKHTPTFDMILSQLPTPSHVVMLTADNEFLDLDISHKILEGVDPSTATHLHVVFSYRNNIIPTTLTTRLVLQAIFCKNIQ